MAVIDKAVVRLSPEQRRELERMGRCGTYTARSLLHALSAYFTFSALKCSVPN